MSAANLLAGMYYAERGWPVFALSASKMPVANCSPCRDADTFHDREACPCLSCHGFYAATTDPERIEAMFLRHPHGLLAIRTGQPSGTVVIDVDVDPELPSDEQPGWANLAKLEDSGLVPDTATVITGSGGLHLIYAHPGGFRIPPGAGRLGKKIDIKADGAYIVAAPSIHPRTGKPYTWVSRADNPTRLTPLHPVLVEQLRERLDTYAPSAHRRTFLSVTPDSRLGGLLRKVIEAPGGQRNDLLFWAAKCAGEMVAAGQITERDAIDALMDAGAAAGLTRSEMVGIGNKGTIGSGMSKGMRR